MGSKTDWSVFLSLGVGYLAVLLWVPLCLAVIPAIGLAWPGEVFGGGDFNWKDSIILFSATGVFVAACLITQLLARPRPK